MAASLIESYAKQFGVTLPEVMAIGRRHYLVTAHLKAFHATTGHDAFGIGLYLGEEKNGSFAPSVGFLELLKDSPRKVTITPEAEWLFICGRDVFEKNISLFSPTTPKLQDQSGLFVIENNLHEALGIAQLQKTSQGLLLKNMLDIGNFLRREH